MNLVVRSRERPALVDDVIVIRDAAKMPPSQMVTPGI